MLIKQLQEQHYYQYMHQLYQQQQCASGDNNTIEMSAHSNAEDNTEEERETSLTEPGKETELTIEASLNSLALGRPMQEMMDEAEEANMWTRKDINEFKDTIRKEESDAIIKIGHGETVTGKLLIRASSFIILYYIFDLFSSGADPR